MAAQSLRPQNPFPKMPMRRALYVLLSLGFGLVVVAAAALAMSRDALWLVVRSCVAAQAAFGRPFPCLEVRPERNGSPGYAVLRAPDSSTHIIVMPTTYIPGIESREVLQDGAGVYWRAALESRRFVVEGAGGRVREDAVGLALNSVETRSQDQLHIHAECFRPDVLAIVRLDPPSPGSGWHPLRAPIDHERYLARTVTRDELASGNVFGLLATLPGSGGDLSQSKVLLVEAGPVFILAVTRFSQESIESLVDENCSATRKRG